MYNDFVRERTQSYVTPLENSMVTERKYVPKK